MPGGDNRGMMFPVECRRTEVNHFDIRASNDPFVASLNIPTVGEVSPFVFIPIRQTFR